MAKICLDTNILLDLILIREHYPQARKIFDFAGSGLLQLYISESSIVNTIFSARNKKTQEIIYLINACTILSADRSIYIEALESDFIDKEDAIQYHVAIHNKCDYFITRNNIDFNLYASEALPIKTPDEFLKEIQPPELP